MKDNEIIKSLEKIYSESVDTHSIYTPLDLCEEMINSISKLEGDILVISNLEFLITLKRNGVDMNTVHYSVNCHLKKQVAITLGVNSNNIYELDYNKKEINLGTEDMKFDVIIQNPPYNPNSLWKKFVLMGIGLLKEDGQMVVIHPDSWRTSSRHKKLFNHLKERISELHIMDYTAFPGITIKTDWYIYNKTKQDKCKIIYSNNESEILNLSKIDRIFRISTQSKPYTILQKITKQNYDNKMVLKKGWEKVNIVDKITDYKICGGKGNGTGWTKNKFSYIDKPCSNQNGAKVVMSYTGKTRARYFNENENVGVITGYYWMINENMKPESIVLLLNSKMLWKIVGKEIAYWHNGDPTSLDLNIIRSLNFENLTAQTEEELYDHFGLTEEEIKWIESEN